MSLCAIIFNFGLIFCVWSKLLIDILFWNVMRWPRVNRSHPSNGVQKMLVDKLDLHFDWLFWFLFELQYIANRRLNSKDGRRWSRRVNYGSQLLCEIINFNNLPPPPSPPPPPPPPPPVPANLRDMGQLGRRKRYPLELQKAIRDVQFIRNHMKRRDEYDAVKRNFPNKNLSFPSSNNKKKKKTCINIDGFSFCCWAGTQDAKCVIIIFPRSSVITSGYY